MNDYMSGSGSNQNVSSAVLGIRMQASEQINHIEKTETSIDMWHALQSTVHNEKDSPSDMFMDTQKTSFLEKRLMSMRDNHENT